MVGNSASIDMSFLVTQSLSFGLGLSNLGTAAP